MMPDALRSELDERDPDEFWGWVKALLHSVYDRPDAASVHAQFDRILDAMPGKMPAVAEHLEAARADLLACTVFSYELKCCPLDHPPKNPTSAAFSASSLIGQTRESGHSGLFLSAPGGTRN